MTSRREFLKKTAVAGAAVALSPSSITGQNTRAHAPRTLQRPLHP
ncbi:MAG: twin-arginine translocation signal domain-containing protein [Fermentimonas sp.]